MAIAVNLIGILLELLRLRISIGKQKWTIFANYTQILNLITMCSSIAFLLFGEAVVHIRYLRACMLTITFILRRFSWFLWAAGSKNS